MIHAEFPFAFATGAETDAKTFADLVKWEREHRGAVNFGSTPARALAARR